MRRLPTGVPETMSRLLRSQFAQTPPAWYQPVLQNPPPVQPPRRQRERPSLRKTAAHDPANSMSTQLNSDRPYRASWDRRVQKGVLKEGPQSIQYEEDLLRRQFFRDFPFEALRPMSLLEMREVRIEDRISGKEWTKLEQRGRYPTVEECVPIVVSGEQADYIQHSAIRHQSQED